MLYTVTSSKNITFSVVTKSAQDTNALGLNIGKNLRGGEVLQLVSDLGGGKTTLTKGIVKGLGSDAIVSSPTFTVQKEYQAGDISVHHFDFYRLCEPGVVGQELQEIIGSSSDIILIEWGDIVSGVLPDGTIVISIKFQSDESRQISIITPIDKKYVLQGLK